MQQKSETSTKAKKHFSKTEMRSLKAAKKRIKRARRAVKHIDKRQLSSRKKIRLQLAQAVRIARYKEKQPIMKTALVVLAAKHGLKQRRNGQSKHLLLLRFLRLDPKTGSTTRHAQAVTALLAKGWTNRKTRLRLLKHGATYFIRNNGATS